MRAEKRKFRCRNEYAYERSAANIFNNLNHLNLFARMRTHCGLNDVILSILIKMWRSTKLSACRWHRLPYNCLQASTVAVAAVLLDCHSYCCCQQQLTYFALVTDNPFLVIGLWSTADTRVFFASNIVKNVVTIWHGP